MTKNSWNFVYIVAKNCKSPFNLTSFFLFWQSYISFFLDERFIRRNFYKELTPVNFENEEFHIIGTMGSSHKSILKVSVFPKKLNDLAPSLRNQVESNEDLAEELDEWKVFLLHVLMPKLH